MCELVFIYLFNIKAKPNMRQNRLKLAAAISLSIAIAGCSSSDNSNSSSTGKLVDSPVAGINYSTATHSGVTGADGSFSYETGELVTFSIGDIVFPETTATSVVTPLSIFNTTDTSNAAVVNLARLLQTLDEDGDASNGIVITEAVHEAAVGSVDFTSDTFDTDVVNLVANSGSTLVSLISEDDAITHLNATLAALAAADPEPDTNIATAILGTWVSGCRDESNSGNSMAASTSVLTFAAGGSLTNTGTEWEDAGCTTEMDTWGPSEMTYSLGDSVTAPDGDSADELTITHGDGSFVVLIRIDGNTLYFAGGESENPDYLDDFTAEDAEVRTK